MQESNESKTNNKPFVAITEHQLRVVFSPQRMEIGKLAQFTTVIIEQSFVRAHLQAHAQSHYVRSAR